MTIPPPPSLMSPLSASLVLVGAGLANGLVAQRLSRLPNPPSITIIEGSTAPFGEHTWSFHSADVTASDRAWLDPLVAHSWAGQQVHFYNHRRTLTSGYASLTSGSMRAAIDTLPNVTLRSGARVNSLSGRSVTLASGEAITADCVIDGRGYVPDPALVLGYQKFVGLEVETTTPHGVALPMIMDASVDQLDGYRFLYLLPFSPTRLLIEDTRYADGGALDQRRLEDDIIAYAAAHGWTIGQIVRRENGVLPIALAFDAEGFWSRKPSDVPQVGMRAALFHPTTGYSLPEAVKIANLVAARWPVAPEMLAGLIKSHALNRARQQGFYRLLNRMLFRAADPDKRHRVLARFYKLGQPLIENFYAGRTSTWDIIRILTGKPPVPVLRALPCLFEKPLLSAEKKDVT